jgi:hypothetical protein
MIANFYLFFYDTQAFDLRKYGHFDERRNDNVLFLYTSQPLHTIGGI